MNIKHSHATLTVVDAISLWFPTCDDTARYIKERVAITHLPTMMTIRCTRQRT